MLTCLFLGLLACCDAFVPNRLDRRVPSRHFSTADSDAEYFSLSGSVWSIAAELTGLRAAAAELAGPTIAIRLAIRLEPPDAEGQRFVSLGGTGALGRVTQGFVWDVDVDEDGPSVENLSPGTWSIDALLARTPQSLPGDIKSVLTAMKKNKAVLSDLQSIQVSDFFAAHQDDSIVNEIQARLEWWGNHLKARTTVQTDAKEAILGEELVTILLHLLEVQDLGVLLGWDIWGVLLVQLANLLHC